MSDYTQRTECAVCANASLLQILNYGNVPLAGDFPSLEELNSENLYPLNILYCNKCGLVQTDSIIDSDALFKDYRYLSSPGLSKHFGGVAEMLCTDFNLGPESKVLDIGCNDGVLLKALNGKVKDAIGIDPSVNVTQLAKDAGCNVVTDYFNDVTCEKYFNDVKFDVVTCCNCFAHINDIHSIVRGVDKVLAPEGTFMIEVHYLKSLVQHLQYDNVYHEHLFSWSLSALNNLFYRHGFTITRFEEIPVHAGSIRVFVRRTNELDAVTVVNCEKNNQAQYETEFPYCGDEKKLLKFQERVIEHISKIGSLVIGLANEDKTIIGYGASGRANMLSHVCDFTPDEIQYIVDESPERAGRYLSRTHIPIISKEEFESKEDRVDYVLIFAWNYAKMIMDKLSGRGYKFIVPFPEPRIVSSVEELDLSLTL